MEIDIKKKLAKNWFKVLQDTICFDIEEIERELSEKRHYTSTNRWIPTGDIKNGYVIGDKHTRLISDAAALDYIIF